MRTHQLEIICVGCFNTYKINVNPNDLINYVHNGLYIQQAFPYLTPSERELILSQICGPCFDKLFKEPI